MKPLVHLAHSATLALVSATVIAGLALLSSAGEAQAQEEPGTFIIETIFDSTVPVPRPGAISYVVSPFTSDLPISPFAETDTRFEYRLTGDFSFSSHPQPDDLGWVFADVACTRNGIDDDAFTRPIRPSDENTSWGLTVAAGEQLVCEATFAWDPPQRTLTIATEIVGTPPSVPRPVSMWIDGFRLVDIPLGGEREIVWAQEQAEIGLIEPPEGFGLLDATCDSDSFLIELGPNDARSWPQADYIAVLNEPFPTCAFRFQAGPTMTVRNSAPGAGATLFTINHTNADSFLEELIDGQTSAATFLSDNTLFITSDPPAGWTVESIECDGGFSTDLVVDIVDGNVSASTVITRPAGVPDASFECVVTHSRATSAPRAFTQHGAPTWDASSDNVALARNESGGALTAVKTDGRLYVRRLDSEDGFGPWVQLGRPDWSTANVAISEEGRVEIIAVKTDGRLYTRVWNADLSFGPWVRHGLATWDPSAQPSIATNDGSVMFVAVKDDGRLFTRDRIVEDGSWGEYVSHGLSTWAQADIATDSRRRDAAFWMVATKQDGRLFTRTFNGSTWEAYTSHGRATWSPTTPPSISTISARIEIAAIKEDGRLFTRSWTGTWSAFVPHVAASPWTAAAVDVAADGTAALVGVQQSGLLSTSLGDAEWADWVDHGLATWSPDTAPAIAHTRFTSVLLATKSDGQLFTRLIR